MPATAGHGTYHNSAYCQAATQLLIFEAVSKCLNTSAPYLHSSTVWSDAIPYSSSRGSFYWIYWNILSRIQNDGWLPSWLKTSQAKADTAPIELSYNANTGLYEATVTNAAAKNTSADYYSHMLDDFSYALPAGVILTLHPGWMCAKGGVTKKVAVQGLVDPFRAVFLATRKMKIFYKPAQPSAVIMGE